MRNPKKNILIFLVLALGVSLIVYSHWIEPQWIEVSRYLVHTGKQQSLVIAHLSDLHIRSIGTRETKILRILEKEKPDVILVTGDSVAENGNYHAVKLFFEKLRAPLGVWIVDGNWEHWRPNNEKLSIYPSPMVRHLNNEGKQLSEGIWIIGFDDELAGSPDLSAAETAPRGAFKIGLFHSPSFYEKAFSKFDLALTGHTHGGQIRIPFLPPLWLPPGSGGFVSGWYQKGNSRMFVSRGLGNSILDVRLFCRPELSIITLQH